MNAVLRPSLLRLEPMTVAHLDAVLTVENAAYAFPWSRGNFVDSLAAGYAADVLLDAGGALVGYCVAMSGVEEMHLLNLTIAPAWQRRGHGRRLLDALVARCRREGAQRLWLEVRSGNVVALALYQACGFVQVGTRRGYYPAPEGRREDARVMQRVLGQPHALD